MNSLYEKINNKFGENNCFIKIDKEKFKMDISFEDEEKEDIEMKIKLYSINNGLILKFSRKKGDKKEFFDNFRNIYELLNN